MHYIGTNEAARMVICERTSQELLAEHPIMYKNKDELRKAMERNPVLCNICGSKRNLQIVHSPQALLLGL